MEKARVVMTEKLEELEVEVDVIYMKLKYKLQHIAMEAKCELKSITERTI